MIDETMRYETLHRHYWRYLMRIDYAHAVTLAEWGCFSCKEAALLLEGLREVEREADQRIGDGKTFKWADDFSYETMIRLSRKTDQASVGKLVDGRTPSDVEQTMYRMALKDRLVVLIDAVLETAGIALAIAKDGKAFAEARKEKDRPNPQDASGPAFSWAYSFLGMFDMLIRDAERMSLAMRHIDRSAMGVQSLSVAEEPRRRERMSELLGFERLHENAYDNVHASDGYVAVYSALQSVGATLGALVRDMEGRFSATGSEDEQWSSAVRETHARCIDTVDRASMVIRHMNGAALGGFAMPEDAFQEGGRQIAGLEIFEPALRAIKRFSALIQVIGKSDLPKGQIEEHNQAEREAVLSNMRRQTGAIANRVQRADHVLAIAVDGLIALKERANLEWRV